MAWNEMWFIQGHWSNGNPFFYCGGHLTRRDAIKEHGRLAAQRSETPEQAWARLKRRGERAVKCRVTPLR